MFLSAEGSTQAIQGIPLVNLIKPPVYDDYVEDVEVIQGEYNPFGFLNDF